MTNPRRAAQPVTQLSEHLDLTKASEYPGLLAIHLAVALAMMLATFSLIGLTTDPSFWIGPTAVIVFLEVVGLLCRHHHWDHAEVQGVQAILVVVIVVMMGGISASAVGSSGSFPVNALHLYRDTLTLIQTTDGHLPPSIGVIWLTTTVVAVLTVLADLLTITLESPGWSLAPLLVIHLAAVLIVRHDTPWWSFALVAASWLIILTVDHALRGGGPLTWLAAAIFSIIAITIATVFAAIAPVWGHLDFSHPAAAPSSPVRMSDPTIELRRNLHNTSTASVITYTTNSPGWSLAPLLVIHLAAVLIVRHDTPWWSFALVAASWLIILTVDHALRGGGPLTWLAAAIFSIIAITIATVFAAIAPVWGHLDFSHPAAAPSSPVRMSDPTIELRRNLHNTSTASVITYTTNSPDGEYLRMTSLSKVTDRGWGLIPVDLEHSAPESVPGLFGPSRTRTVDINITGFSSQYLPAPYGPIAADVDQTWAWDPQDLTIVSTSADHDHATSDMQYSISAQEPDPDPVTFDNAKAGTPNNSVYTEVPANVPSSIRDLTSRIIKGKSTPVTKAIAIQNWLRDSARFHYDINAPEGDGYQVLENFLLRTHRGYCIHFAASMALMARLEGIPSRVSVGFLPGDHARDTWKIRANQMHAWPELYFQDYGWVRFEPTAAVAPAPTWTDKETTIPSPSSTPSSSPTPSTQTSTPSPEPSPAAAPTSTPTSSPAPISTADHEGFNWAPLSAVLVILVILALPMLIRMLISRRRITRGSIAGIWREIRDLWIDHGLAWPDGTPRRQAAALVTDMDPDTSAAVKKLALAEEMDRWSSKDGHDNSLPDDLGAVKAWLARTPTPRPHWLATWLPTSLVKK